MLVSCISSYVHMQDSNFKVQLTRQVGASPIKFSTYIYKKFATSSRVTGIPSFFDTYRVYQIPIPINHEIMSDTLFAVCGLYKGDKFVIVDSNNNNDLSDDRHFRFAYDRESFLNRLSDTGEPPEIYSLDKVTLLDRYLGNEVYLNYIDYKNGNSIQTTVLVEVIPNLNVSPYSNDTQSLNDFDLTFLLVLAEHWKGEVVINDVVYEIFVTQRGFTRINGKAVVYVREKQKGIITAEFDEFSFTPQEFVTIGDQVYKADFQVRNRSVNFVWQQSSADYITSLEHLNKEIESFSSFSFNDSTLVEFPLQSDKPSLIHFWGSWCAPCKKDMPLLVELNQEFNEGINFLGVATEINAINNDAKLMKIVNDYRISWPQVSDTTSLTEDLGIASDFKITSFPTYIIVSKSGEILCQSGTLETIKKYMQEMYGKE